MKKLFLIAGILLLVACKKQPVEIELKGNFEVELLFEKDGCKVYRFYDGRYVYYSDCRGKVEYEYRTSNGKGGGQTHRVETLNN